MISGTWFSKACYTNVYDILRQYFNLCYGRKIVFSSGFINKNLNFVRGMINPYTDNLTLYVASQSRLFNFEKNITQ